MALCDRVVVLAFAGLFGGACSVAYRPCPVGVAAPLPQDTFARSADALRARYGGLSVAEQEPLRLQTDWVESQDLPGERRFSVFVDRDELVVVAEVRWLREPWFGPPEWSEVRGDPAAERELADFLRGLLTAP